MCDDNRINTMTMSHLVNKLFIKWWDVKVGKRGGVNKRGLTLILIFTPPNRHLFILAYTIKISPTYMHTPPFKELGPKPRKKILYPVEIITIFG